MLWYDILNFQLSTMYIIIAIYSMTIISIITCGNCCFTNSDIDECVADTDGCSQICNNTVGSFECSCMTGFTLLDDGETCAEVNECSLNIDNCQQECINISGGFRCGCYEGFSLNLDLRTCSGMCKYIS